jgi:hypothetical protein
VKLTPNLQHDVERSRSRSHAPVPLQPRFGVGWLHGCGCACSRVELIEMPDVSYRLCTVVRMPIYFWISSHIFCEH